MKLQNEELLIERIKGGDSESYGRLVDFYTPTIYNLCFRMLGNNSDADDAASMTFFNGYKNIRKFRGDCEFSSWLYKIGINICKTMLKKQKRDHNNLSNIQASADKDENFDIFETIEAKDADVEKKVIANEDLQLLKKALRKMPGKYLEVIMLHDIEGKSYLEIAETTNSGIGTVKSRISRGRKILLDFINNAGNK